MPMPRNDKCLVTLLIGEYYRKMWEFSFADTWRRYAEAHGYDIVVIDDHIDRTGRARERSPHWQKALILEHPDVQPYRHAVWIDSDVLINHHKAPCVVSATAPGRVGAVSYNSLNAATAKLHANRQEREYDYSMRFGHGDPLGLGRAPTARDRYRAIGINTGLDDWINTGVLVFEVEAHRALLRDFYDRYAETPHSIFENVPLSFHLLDSGMVDFIDTRFNADYLFELMEYYPFLLLKEFKTDSRDNLRLRILAANVLWENNFFLHCVSGVPTARDDIRWIFRDQPEWDKYLFRFRDEE